MSGSPIFDTEKKPEKLSEANLYLRHALRRGGVISREFLYGTLSIPVGIQRTDRDLVHYRVSKKNLILLKFKLAALHSCNLTDVDLKQNLIPSGS